MEVEEQVERLLALPDRAAPRGVGRVAGRRDPGPCGGIEGPI